MFKIPVNGYTPNWCGTKWGLSIYAQQLAEKGLHYLFFLRFSYCRFAILSEEAESCKRFLTIFLDRKLISY